MKKLLFVFTAGAFASLAMAPTNFWPSLFLGLSILYIALERSTSWKKSALLGFAFSMGYFSFSLSWIGNALLVEGNPYWWAWPLAVSGLPLILSCFTAITAALHFHAKKFSFPAFLILIFCAEFARSHLFTGFPWNLYGYTWIDIKPIAQIASLYNIYLLTFLTILWATTPAYIALATRSKTQKTTLALVSILTFTASYLYGINRIQNYVPQEPGAHIIIVQPNIKQYEKWDNDKRPQHFMNLIELSSYQGRRPDNKTHIILWPETAIAQDIINAPWAMDILTQMLQTYPGEVYLITGALRYDNENYYNSIITFDKNTNIVHTYDKSRLVPFGEYMPLSNIFNIAPIVGFTGFKKGAPPKPVSINDTLSFFPLICYEIIFPMKKEVKASMIINTTNDAWYGNSAGPHQHLVQAQFRAIETGLPVFRSAGTGISAVIDPLGHITQKAALNQRNRITSP